MNQEKKLILTKFNLKTNAPKIGLPPKNILKLSDSRPQSAINISQMPECKADLPFLLQQLETENKLIWISKCYATFKEWSTQPEQNDSNREIILKQSLTLIEHNDLQVRLMAIKSSLMGFMTMDLLGLLFQKKTVKSLRRPVSGSKMNDQLTSLLYQPQQFMVILQKAVMLSNEKVFVTLLTDNPINFVLFKLLKLFNTLPKDQAYTQQQLPYLVAIFTLIKNAANNSKEQQKFLQNVYIQLINNYLHTLQIDCAQEKELINLYSIITASLRNMAIESNSTEIFLQNGIMGKLVISMSKFANHYDLILNTLRLMSKMSLNKECCEYFLQNHECMRNISNFFKIYQTNIYVIIRLSFLLANMTTYFEGIRQMLFYEFNVFEDIYRCFDYYWNKEINPKSLMDPNQFAQSHAAWDFQILSQEKDIDALIRIIRLIANILTIEQIGHDILKNYQNIYKSLIIQLLKLLQKNSSIKQNQELISCSLSCLSNLTFYEKQVLLSDFEYKNVKLELISLLGHFVIQNDDQEICCDGLRVLSNLSRQKELIKQIIKTRVAEGAIVLLDSNSKEVVYYSLGVLMNILQDQEFKQKEYTNIIDQIVQVINDCSPNENDIANLSLRCLILLLDITMSQEYAKKIENAVFQFGSICDQVLKDTNNNSLQNSRQLINQIINNIPEEAYPCMQPNCGRKFKSLTDLQTHVSRRHKL